jgi:outer membrane protein assembly factor BamB
MRKIFIPFCFLLLLFSSVQKNLQAQASYSEQWPGFRGPLGCGFIENVSTPVKWSLDSTKSIKWKTPIPGLGHSSPVIWDDCLFVTTASNSSNSESLRVGLYGDSEEANDNTEHQFKVYCLDKHNGKIIWERVAHKGIPKSKRHTKASQANCTPATDGKYLVVHFGSEGLYCYDLKGNLIWKKDMGLLNPGYFESPGIEWGYSSSPVIFKDKIIIQCDIPRTPYITVLDLATGNDIWNTSRGDEVQTYSTPAIYSKDGKTQVITNGYRYMCGYDFYTGKQIWRLSNGGDIPTPTPVIANDLIYLNSAHGKYSPIFVVRPNATGDITLAPDSTKNQYIAWSVKRGGAYMQTPLIYQSYLYNLQINGQLTCFDAITGAVKYKENLKEAFTASGIAADGKLYFSSEEGNVYVIKAGQEFQLLAKNALKDICMATPAISGNTLFFRTQHFLYAFESPVWSGLGKNRENNKR